MSFPLPLIHTISSLTVLCLATYLKQPSALNEAFHHLVEVGQAVDETYETYILGLLQCEMYGEALKVYNEKVFKVTCAFM